MAFLRICFLALLAATAQAAHANSAAVEAVSEEIATDSDEFLMGETEGIDVESGDTVEDYEELEDELYADEDDETTETEEVETETDEVMKANTVGFNLESGGTADDYEHDEDMSLDAEHDVQEKKMANGGQKYPAAGCEGAGCQDRKDIPSWMGTCNGTPRSKGKLQFWSNGNNGEKGDGLINGESSNLRKREWCIGSDFKVRGCAEAPSFVYCCEQLRLGSDESKCLMASECGKSATLTVGSCSNSILTQFTYNNKGDNRIHLKCNPEYNIDVFGDEKIGAQVTTWMFGSPATGNEFGGQPNVFEFGNICPSK